MKNGPFVLFPLFMGREDHQRQERNSRLGEDGAGRDRASPGPGIPRDVQTPTPGYSRTE